MLHKTNNRNIIFVLLLALSVRLMGISARPIWYDEAFAILFSAKGPASMLYGTLASTTTGAADIHPLGYYTLLWVWIRAFGQSLVVVRSLSILAGIITVYFAYLFSEKLFDGRFASVAAVFVALSPFHIHYSQEIRMYSFLAMWLMIATYAYLRGSTQRSWRWWALFSVTAVLAQYTHNLAALYLIPLAITPFLQRDRKNMLTVTLAGFGAILLYFPWLLQLPSQITKISNAYWVERPGFAKIFTLFLTFVTNLPLPDGWLLPALFIALSAISIGIVQTLRVSNKNAAALWLLYLSFAPPILLFLVSQWIPIYIERALLPSGVIFCIWLAWAMFSTSLPKMIRNILVGMLVIGAAMGMIQHVTYRDFPYAPYQELDTLIRKRKASEDVVIHSNKLSIIPAVYYDPTLPQLFIADPPGSRTDTLAQATQEVLGLESAPDVETATGQARRVWFIIFTRSIKEIQSTGQETHSHLGYLYQNFRLLDINELGGLQVYLFERKQ